MAMLCSQRRLVLDLSEVPFIDSGGLGALIAGIRRIHERGGAVVVTSSRAPVARLLRTAGFDRFAPLVTTREEAVAMLRSVRTVPSN
jgi:anti-sigma B factor antagonist